MSDHQTTAVLSAPPDGLDYSLTGINATVAVEKGLAEADWYQTFIPRATMRRLLERRDGPAIRDTLVWFALILGSGYAAFALWGSWWAIIPLALYGVLYASTSDSRWHESSHGTAFRTDATVPVHEPPTALLMGLGLVWWGLGRWRALDKGAHKSD